MKNKLFILYEFNCYEPGGKASIKAIVDDLDSQFTIDDDDEDSIYHHEHEGLIDILGPIDVQECRKVYDNLCLALKKAGVVFESGEVVDD